MDEIRANLLEWLRSKRTKDLLLATLVALLLDVLPIEFTPETFFAIMGMFGVKIAGQSLSDLGKGKAEVEKKSKD